MQVAIRGKNIELTNALRDYVEKKVGKIERYADQPVNAQVNLAVEHGRHIIEVTALLGGMHLRSQEATGDMYASIDLVTDKLEKQMIKYKTRLKRRGKENGISEPMEAVDVDGQLVKTKRFPIKPMALEEAMIRMDMLSHDFFAFTNADTDRINVLYRRKDGNYGLLEPEA